MPADIFNKTTNVLGGAWSADGAAFVFSGAAANLLGVGMIVQQVNIGYQQQITRLYEIGSTYTYYVAGRVQGNMTVGRIVGPHVIMARFYQTFGDVCNAQNNTLNLFIGTGCGAVGAAAQGGAITGAQCTNGRFTISYAVLTNVGISVAAQDMVINEQLQLMFINMSSQGSGGCSGGGITGGFGNNLIGNVA
jgi:hypothetical protein